MRLQSHAHVQAQLDREPWVELTPLGPPVLKPALWWGGCSPPSNTQKQPRPNYRPSKPGMPPVLLLSVIQLHTKWTTVFHNTQTAV